MGFCLSQRYIVRVQPLAQPRPPAFSWPLALWLGLQLLVLLPPALQIPLADVYPRPVERLALRHVAVGQIILAGLLFPLILRSLNASVAAIGATWPFLMLAGILSSAQMPQVTACAGYVSAWMTLLALCNCIARQVQSRMRLVAISAMCTIGAAGLMYLCDEFGSQRSEAQAGILQRTPVFAAIELAGNAAAPVWAPMAWGLGLAVGIIGAQWLRNARKRASSGESGPARGPIPGAAGDVSQKVGEEVGGGGSELRR